MEFDSIIEEMKNASLDLTGCGRSYCRFCGSQGGNNISPTQPHQIDSILKELRLDADKTATENNRRFEQVIIEEYNSGTFWQTLWLLQCNRKDQLSGARQQNQRNMHLYASMHKIC